MKKALFFAGLAAATLAFVGCNKEADLAGNGTPFEIVLNTVDTRTVNNGMNTLWKENDALSVFYASAGGEEWSGNTKFTVSDAESGLAKGEVTLTAASYDWYLFYPYTSQMPNPKSLKDDGTRGGYVYIGSGASSAQKQSGLNSTAHLAGGDLPMVGVQKGVPASETPSVPMKHLTTVARVNVTNTTSEAVTITAVAFTAPENVVGTYYIDFSGTEPVITDSDDTHVGKTARLDVKDAEPLDPGATASFYIAMKPFTAPAGSTLKVQVYAGSEVSTSELELTNAVSFQANHIKKLNVDYAPEAVAGQTLAEALELEDGADVTLAPLTVGAVTTKGYVVTDGTDGLYVFVNAKPSVNVGDQVKVTGKMGTYFGVRQVAGPSQTVVTEGDGTFESTWTDITANFEAYTNTSSAPVKYEATVVKNGTYTNFKVEGADTYVGTLTNAPSAMFEGVGEGDEVVVYGYFSTINTGSKLVGVYAYKVEVVSTEAPFFDADVNGSKEVTVSALTQTVTINVSGNVDWTAEPSEGAAVDPASGNGAGTITVSFPSNTDPDNTKEYSVAVRTDDPTLLDAGEDEAIIYITQEAAGSGYAFVKVTSAADLTDGQYLIVNEKASVALRDAVDESSNTISVTVTGGQIGADETTMAAAFVFTASDGAFKGPNGKYLAHSGTRNTLNPTDDSSPNTVTISGGDATIKAEDDYFIQYNKSSDQKRFRYYKNAQGDGEVQLYKLGSGVEPPATPVLVSIAVSDMTTEYTVGDTFSFDGTVTATYDNGSENTVTPTSVSEPDMSTAGTETVTVTYTEGGVTKEATYTITVSASDKNTLSKTMGEVVEDNEYELSSGNDNIHLYTTVPLNGSVRMSTSGKPNCGAFYADESYGAHWRLYEGSAGDVTFSVAEGCELKSVKIRYFNQNSGRLYDGGTEIASNTLYEVSGSSVTYTVGHASGDKNGQVRIAEVEIVYTGDGTFPDVPTPGPTEIATKITLTSSAAVYVGATYALNATSNVPGATITYESEDTAIATVDANGVVTGVAEGTVKVYARITGVPGEYTDAERYCNVIVSTKPAEEEGTELITFSELGYANAEEVTTVKGTNFTMVFDKGEGSYAPKYYDAGTNVRIYKNNTLTISSDKTITKIEFLCTKDYDVHSEAVFSTGSCSDNVWTGSAKSVEMLNGTSGTTQIRLTGVKVTFE